MSTLVRRIRGAVGNGIVWGLAWIGARLMALGFGAAIGGLPLEQVVSLVLPVAASAGAIGFTSGVTFSGLFGALNRRRHLPEVGRLSTALLGGAAGLAFPIGIFGYLVLGGAGVTPITLVLNVAIGATLGASVAAGSLRLAQSESRSVGDGPHDLLQEAR